MVGSFISTALYVLDVTTSPAAAVINQAVGSRIAVMFDSGIRRGSDIIVEGIIKGVTIPLDGFRLS